jgi:hypothetical protein
MQQQGSPLGLLVHYINYTGLAQNQSTFRCSRNEKIRSDLYPFATTPKPRSARVRKQQKLSTAAIEIGVTAHAMTSQDSD